MLAAALVATALATASCGTSGGNDAQPSDKTTTTESASSTTAEGTDTTDTTEPAEPSDDPAATLRDAVDTTLAVNSFTIDSQLDLRVGPESFSLASTGSFDYEALVGELEIQVEGADSATDLAVRTDGDKLWVRSEGDDAPTIPDGKTWLEGDHDLLASSSTVAPSGVIGVIIALRGAEEATAVDTGEVDGVETTIYETTVGYDEAVKAAGKDRAVFESALQLTAPEPPDLVMTVEVGSDGIIRNFDLAVESTDRSPIEGGYQVELTDVNDEVEVPEAPSADDTLTGPEADKILATLIT